MRDQIAPRGRRALLRGVVLALLALVAPGTATGAVAAEPAAPAVTVFEGQSLAIDAFAAPDGAVVSIERDDRAVTLARFGADGPIARSVLASDRAGGGYVAPEGRAQPLADGTLGLIVKRWRRQRGAAVTLLRIAGDGAVAERIALPAAARAAHAYGLEADGTVWWARSCRDELHRRAPDGRHVVVRLPRLGCPRGGDREAATALAVGADGAIWTVNFCQRRIVRLGADGRLRQWRTPNARCAVWGLGETYIATPTLTADPRGGILWFTSEQLFGDVREDGFGGRALPDGRLLRPAPAGWKGYFDATGAYWRPAERISPDGRTRRPLGLPDGRTAAAVAPAVGGGTWLVGSRGRFTDGNKQSYWTYDDAAVALLAADGTRLDWPLAPLIGAAPAAGAVKRALLDGDGALWVGLYGMGSRTLRIAAPQLSPPRPSAARPTGVTGRRGRVVTLQLACDAAPGRWCQGAARLDGVTAPQPFVVAGQGRAAVRLTLSGGAVRGLRRGDAVRTTATVVSDGAGTASRELTLRP